MKSPPCTSGHTSVAAVANDAAVVADRLAQILKGQLYMKGERHKLAAEPWHLDVGEECPGSWADTSVDFRSGSHSTLLNTATPSLRV